MLYFIAKNFYWFQILFKSNGTNTLFPCISLCMIGFEKHWSKLNPSFLCLALIKSSGNRITLAPFIFFIKQLLVRKLSFYSLSVIYQECCDIKLRIVIFTNVCFSYFFMRLGLFVLLSYLLFIIFACKLISLLILCSLRTALGSLASILGLLRFFLFDLLNAWFNAV